MPINWPIIKMDFKVRLKIVVISTICYVLLKENEPAIPKIIRIKNSINNVNSSWIVSDEIINYSTIILLHAHKNDDIILNIL